MVRTAFSVIVAIAVMVLLLQGAPRVLFDYRHADEFVPAEGLTVTQVKCSTWLVAALDHCTTWFESQAGVSGELDDWRFGRATIDKVEIMQWRRDSSIVTSNMSLDGVVSRLAFVAAVAVGGGLLLVLATAREVMGRRRRDA